MCFFFKQFDLQQQQFEFIQYICEFHSNLVCKLNNINIFENINSPFNKMQT